MREGRALLSSFATNSPAAAVAATSSRSHDRTHWPGRGHPLRLDEAELPSALREWTNPGHRPAEAASSAGINSGHVYGYREKKLSVGIRMTGYKGLNSSCDALACSGYRPSMRYGRQNDQVIVLSWGRSMGKKKQGVLRTT